MNTNALTLDSQSSTLGRSPWLSRSRRRPFVVAPQLERTLEGHTDWVRSVAVTPDGRRAVSAGDDARVRVWDLETGQLAGIQTTSSAFQACATNGRSTVLGGGDGSVDFLAFENFPETNLRWWITPRRLWRFGPFTTLNPAQAPAASPFSPQRGEGPGMRGGAAQDTPFHDEGERRARQRKRATQNAGHRDDEWTARCPRCGKEIPAPQPVLEAITSFAATPPPDAAEDRRLFFDCPDCHGPLRSTPFVCGTP